MSRYRTVLLGIIVGLSSCAEKKVQLSQSEVNAKIDSMVGERITELNERSMEDLSNRMSIEVKVKTDSILAKKALNNPAPPVPTPPVTPDSAAVQP